MLGIGGRFAGARGMVVMPNLANLSPSAATSAIISAGLRARNASSSDTSSSGDNDKVFGQSVAAGTLVDYDTEIDYSYYRYVAPAVVYTLDSQKIYYGTTYNQFACNQQPNQNVTGVANASNEYFYCRREARPIRYKLLANGIWDGVSYGGYDVEYASIWTCEFVADQCGNTEQSRVVDNTGSCQPNGTRSIIYKITYKAGNIGYITQLDPCTYVNKTQLYTYKTYLSSCIGGGGCDAGYRIYDEYAYYSDGTTDKIRSQATECCPCGTYEIRTDNYYFACENGFRRCTYRVETYDCLNRQISNIRYDCPSLCCSADVLVGCTDYPGQGGYTRVCTYRKCDGSTYDKSTTYCNTGCGSYYDTGKCTSTPYGRYKTQARTCTRSDCSTYTETRTVAC